MQMDPALRHRNSYSTGWRSVRGIERRERGESVKNLLDFCHGTVTMSCPRNSQGCRKRIRKLLLTSQGSGRSLQAIDYKEVREYPPDGVGIRLPVRTEAQGWNGLHPCRIGRHDFLERFAPASCNVEACDLHRKIRGAYQQAFAAVEKSHDALIWIGNEIDFYRLSTSGRVQPAHAFRIDCQNELAIRSRQATNRTFGREWARRPALCIQQKGARAMAGFGSSVDDRFVVGQPRKIEVVGLVICELLGLAHSGGKQEQLCRRAYGCNHPIAVRRKRAEPAVAQPDCRRAVRLPHEDAVIGTHGLARFRKKYGLAIRRHVQQQRPIEPGQTAFACFSGRQSGNTDARLIEGQQYKARTADVVDGQASRRSINETLLA